MKSYILLYSGTSIISWLIKRITGSQFSHTTWIFDDEIIEAIAGGVKENKLSEYPTSKIVIIDLKLSQEVINKCFTFAKQQVGKPYDYRLLFTLFWWWLTNKKRDRNVEGNNWSSSYDCSKLIGMNLYINANGFRFDPNVHPDNTEPKDIWKYAKDGNVNIIYLGKDIDISKN